RLDDVRLYSDLVAHAGRDRAADIMQAPSRSLSLGSRSSSLAFPNDQAENLPPSPSPNTKSRPTIRVRFARIALTGDDIGTICSRLFLVRAGGNTIKPLSKSISDQHRPPNSSRRCPVSINRRTRSP